MQRTKKRTHTKEKPLGGGEGESEGEQSRRAPRFSVFQSALAFPARAYRRRRERRKNAHFCRTTLSSLYLFWFALLSHRLPPSIPPSSPIITPPNPHPSVSPSSPPATTTGTAPPPSPPSHESTPQLSLIELNCGRISSLAHPSFPPAMAAATALAASLVAFQFWTTPFFS